MLRAHGLDAGPTQRPLLAGGIAGALADLAGLAVLAPFGSLAALADAIGRSVAVAGTAHCVAMAMGGVLYGWLFQRAANDRRGGWLFGLAYGFLLWMAVPVPLLQWLPDRPSMTGAPAAGLLLAQLAWGLVLGLAFPRVHRPLQARVDCRSPGAHGRLGPAAAAATAVSHRQAPRR